MANIIDIINSSDDEILKTVSKDIGKWSKLRHTKEDLELFLGYNIAEIQFLTNNGKSVRTIFCTANGTLINLLQRTNIKQEDEQKFLAMFNKNIKSKQNNEVILWDIEDKTIKTLKLTEWHIINFVSLSMENVILLNKVIKEAIKQ